MDGNPGEGQPPRPPIEFVRAEGALEFVFEGFRDAVGRLDGFDATSRIDRVGVIRRRPPREDEEEDETEVELETAHFFGRFVTLLSRLTIRAIQIELDWHGLPDDDMERFFGNVMPGHRTLQEIRIDICDLHPRYFRLLTEKVLSLVSLKLYTTGAIDRADRAQADQAMVDMLNRNAAITSLEYFFSLDADHCKPFGQAVTRNTYLEDLSIVVREVGAGSLDGVAASSSLQRLHVWGSISDEALSSLARRLRTNNTLQSLQLDGQTRNAPQAMVDLVKTYNCTLHVHRPNLLGWPGPLGEQLEAYRRRNARIRHLLQIMQDPDPDPDPDPDSPPESRRVVPRFLLPTLLGIVSDLPTVLHRILRMGNVHTVSEILAAKLHGNPRTPPSVSGGTVGGDDAEPPGLGAAASPVEAIIRLQL